MMQHPSLGAASLHSRSESPSQVFLILIQWLLSIMKLMQYQIQLLRMMTCVVLSG